MSGHSAARHFALRHNPPWLFGLLGIPNGLANAIIVVLMPYFLRRQGVGVDRIAEIVALASIPNVWYFLYSPMVDMGLPRRVWILAGDAVANGAGAVLLLWIAGYARRHFLAEEEPAAATAP